ncbi:(2Fe-2S)-binding protein [Aestuariibacter sp. AA17]|uniref:(2Fe-2S)-binding protein n=1 Tax=Fluctibacter corallii TaxID=2984329 RepID=A0ABT3A6Z5_9ALTE|nr:(2Fe-2S)-binding protein [Aestuariibacter sp. AA17]MCV2884451.1 (2Fe-2S)-binding protein [Aestuariibacter sp. AA17]
MPTVKLLKSGIDVSLAENSSLCELDYVVQPDLMFGCRSAACGTCAIRVVEGLDNLSPKNEAEEHLLDTLCINDETHRLACQCKLSGDVAIEALED